MANNVLLHNALHGIGFTQAAAAHIVDDQGFDEPTDYAMLTDDEAVSLCKTIRRPGGTMANGNPNQGFSVSLKAENNLKLMCFYLRYKQRASRTLVITDITPDNIKKMVGLSRYEKDHTDPTQPEIVVRNNWTRTVDVVEDFLRNCLGTTKVPLAWVIRDQVVPTPEANDPAAAYLSQAE